MPLEYFLVVRLLGRMSFQVFLGWFTRLVTRDITLIELGLSEREEKWRLSGIEGPIAIKVQIFFLCSILSVWSIRSYS